MKCYHNPTRLVRDVAFVVACPSLLENSENFPLVDDSQCFWGADWRQCLAWLQELDREPSIVHEYFAQRNHRGRLGLHFQDCVEFWLRHFPRFTGHDLVTTQVVRTYKQHAA